MGDVHYIRGYSMQPPAPKLAKQVLIERARAYLKERRVPFQERNNGTVFLIEGPGGKISFWPTTSKWSDHAEGVDGEGIRHLVDHWLGAYDQIEKAVQASNADLGTPDDEVPW